MISATDALAKLRKPAAEGAGLREQLREFASAAKIKPKATCDADGVWVSTAGGKDRQIVYVVRGAGNSTTW